MSSAATKPPTATSRLRSADFSLHLTTSPHLVAGNVDRGGIKRSRPACSDSVALKGSRAMDLIRGWESQYLPSETGILRLSTAEVYRDLGEEDGVGDQREGEIRIAMSASVQLEWPESPTGLDLNSEPMDLELPLIPGDPPISVPGVTPGEKHTFQQPVPVQNNLNPFLFCLAREPGTKKEWETLRAALPARYDAWTKIRDVQSLQFEIQCGIERWMKLNELTERKIYSFKGWVAYSYDTIPSTMELDDFDFMKMFKAYLEKRRAYKDQQEYRLGWSLQSPQMLTLPSEIYVELTRTGLSMFEPWSPPDE